MKKPRHGGRGLVVQNKTLAPSRLPPHPLHKQADQCADVAAPALFRVSPDWLKICAASRNPDDSLTVALQRANLKRRASRASVLKVVR